MNNSLKTLVIVVTFNRCDLLVRCLNNIKEQTVKPDDILVINNNSTDNTAETLNKMNINNICQDNVGSAGGWARGIEYAIDNNFDAVWLMDDDGYPDINAYSELIKVMHGNVSCASSIVVKENNAESFVFPYPILNKNLFPIIFSIPRKVFNINDLIDISINNTYPFAHFFNGALISIKSIKEIGNVNKNYFMFGDELDYLFRLRKVGDVISVIKAIHFHPDVSKRPYNSFKIYYYIKNTLILNKKYYDYPLLRSFLALLVVLYRSIKRNGIIYGLRLILGFNNGIFYLAIIRGFKGKIGIDHFEKY